MELCVSSVELCVILKDKNLHREEVDCLFDGYFKIDNNLADRDCIYFDIFSGYIHNLADCSAIR